MKWNVLVTVQPGSGHEHQLLGALSQFGRFHATTFRDVCIGTVEDVGKFLQAIRLAAEANKPWTVRLGRVIPVETTFSFTLETLGECLKRAAAPFVERMTSGSFLVRLERRGFEGRIRSQAVEQEVAGHLFEIAAQQGKTLRTDFDDPDYIVVAETLGQECGVALLTRDIRSRYPFVQSR
jgi:tRNA(Ser,Leu) C12 N-acetylase TAN1